MRRRVPGPRRAGQNGAENDNESARDIVDGDDVLRCAPRPLPRPSHLTSVPNGRTRSGAMRRRATRLGAGDLVVDGASALLGRYGSDTVSDALVAGWGMREISSILRWALADLAVALREVERRMALASDETPDGLEQRRLFVGN
jgi:hypothetical protein